MTVRLEQILKQLSPEQVEALTAQAESMIHFTKPVGRKLKLDWAGCVDSEHRTGLEAQHAAMASWTDALDRNIDL